MKKIRTGLRGVAFCAASLATLGMSTQFAHADGTIVGDGNWSVYGWTTDFLSLGINAPWGGKGANGTRTWSGTDTSFTTANGGTTLNTNGVGGWFQANWNSPGGNWIPDISRAKGAAGRLNSMATNYNIQWDGSGSVNSNGSSYTFGLKFNLAVQNADGTSPGWPSYGYDNTRSYECYIVTQSDHHPRNSTDTRWRLFGAVYPPGDPVGYDCYVYDAYWGGTDNGSNGQFKQLWAWRKQNTWSGPVNVQAIVKYWADNSGTSLNYNTWYMNTGMSIAPETFSTAGWFRADNIRIPDLNTALPMPTNLISNPSFDAENYDTQTPSGWSEWENTGSATSSYTEGYGGSNDGARHGTHYKTSAYQVYTYQVKTGLANGLYTLRAYARRGGNQTHCYLEAAKYDVNNVNGTKRTVNIPASSTYKLIEIKDINVTNGQCQIGFWSNANSGDWAYFDDVKFFKQ